MNCYKACDDGKEAQTEITIMFTNIINEHICIHYFIIKRRKTR